MKSEPGETHREFCWVCHRARAACLCPAIEPFETGPRFVILMHPKERRLRTGTGRMAHLLLRDSVLREGVDFTHDPLVNRLLADPAHEPLLLYPGRHARQVDQGLPLGGGGQRLLIFVLDATWPCAKKMLKQSRNLHDLPRLTCAPGARSRFRFKRQPAPSCLATAEAIFLLLDALESQAPGTVRPPQGHHALLAVMERMVRFQIGCANDPGRPGYRRRSHREHDGLSHARRWLHRSLLFDP